MINKWIEITRRLYIRRTENRIEIAVMSFDAERPDESKSVVKERFFIDLGIWASVFLETAAFGERPNDWQPLMDHITGKYDLLETAKNLENVRNCLKRIPEILKEELDES